MTINKALEKLFSLHQFGIKLGLDSIIKLLDFLGNPQKHLKCFHIAGSNGKGSTSSFIASILCEAGFKVGLYTSPHLVRFNERIRINGEEIDNKFIIYFMNLTAKYIESNPVTFFELTTAMAFLYFQQNNVDYAVIETGLGGRLDATNIIKPVASLITTISREHTNILGNSIEEIAAEKAAIIKENSKAFIGLINNDIKNIFVKKSFELNSECFFLSDHISKKDDNLLLQTGIDSYHVYETPLQGDHQLNNAALAVLAITKTLPFIDELYISKGIRSVLTNSGIQCRYEIYNTYPRVIFDAAHNLEGIQSFINQFRKEMHRYEKKILIYGSMKDKDFKDSIRLLRKYFDEIFMVSIEYERALDKNELVKIASDLGITSNALENPEIFIRQFILNKKSNQCLVALGSIYILGQVKSKLLSNSNKQ